jgi:hypothetical protein
MKNVMQTGDQEISILNALEDMPVNEAKLLLTRIANNRELPTKASAPSSPQRRPLWKILLSFPYSVETMDSLMAFVGVLISLLAFLFVLTLFIEHLYHLFWKN